MRIGIDAMGGDRAPAAEVKGALAARSLLDPDDRIMLVGDEKKIRAVLGSRNEWRDFIDIQHTAQRVGMDESPVDAVRAKPDSSLMTLVELHAAGEIDACISAGNTGAFVAAATVRLRRLRGVHRPGIAIVVPTLHGPVVVCDVGANVSCRPQHLYQYSVMASVYAERITGISNPRIGPLSVGQEDTKGTILVRDAHALLKADDMLYFVGNVESRDLFRGACDVMICDGFAGNVVLKLIEGMGEGLLREILQNVRLSVGPVAAHAAQKAVLETKHKYDFNEYGGAPLLGVGGTCIICHGASDARGIKNGVRQTKAFVRHHVNDRIIELLARNQRIPNG
ncbi:MAG: phosphate acyltransferase PlsX [Phycisphaerae bacterium]|nr:phosphate acyltransferase PlsX [Phycisphaerae bacterium]